MLVVLALGAWYYIGATEHSRRVNVSWSRADQSGYVGDAMLVYQNWHGGGPGVLIGERNRMPIYAGVLALFYDPSLTAHAFFERGKQVNIILSMALLVLLGVVFSRYLPAVAAVPLLLVIAFGYFVFRAGYVQCELLFYTILFLAVLGFAHLLQMGPSRRQVLLGGTAGIVAACAHLTKAAVLPLVGIFVVVFTVSAVVAALRQPRLLAARELAWRTATLAVFVLCFLATLSPYISNSKRVFGHYFYNVNSTFYVWYDDWPSAMLGTYSHGDGVGWPKMLARDLPGLRRYLREHSVEQIAARILDGFRDLIVVNYQRYWIMKFIVLYLAFAVAVALSQRRALRGFVRAHAALVVFLVLYAVVYLLAIAFYKPISGTTSRMFLAHVAPLLFALTWFVTRPPLDTTAWRVAGTTIATRHVHLLIAAMILADVGFMLWPRLFADFTGY